MATIKTISAALKLVDVKKESLRKAFEELQNHSSSLSSFNLTWSDLDSHFTSLQSSLECKFKLLQSQQTDQQQQQKQLQCQPSKQPPDQSKPKSQSQSFASLTAFNGSEDSVSVPARPELKQFCEKMDGLGLRNYIIERSRERNAIRAELLDALSCAPDAAAMVLVAMEVSDMPYSVGDKDLTLSNVRRGRVTLLEQLMKMRVEIKAEVKERAKKLASEWREKVSISGENPLETLCFLLYLAAYGLTDDFEVEDLINLAVVIAQHRQAVELCRVLSFGDRISDIIVKLINQGKQLLAVKFIFEFELTDKFPPVPLLKEHVKESKNVAKKVHQSGNTSLKSLNEATSKEVSALKSVIKIIEDHNLGSEYPKGNLWKRIEKLEKDKAGRKRPPPATAAAKMQQQSMPKKLSGRKRPRNTAAAGPATLIKSVAAASSAGPAFQQSHLQAAGSLSERPTPYLSSPVVPYGLAGSTPAVAEYAGPSTGLYVSAGGSFGNPGNLMLSRPHIYPSESNMPSGYPDRSIAYGGYALSHQYHPPYYPQ